MRVCLLTLLSHLEASLSVRQHFPKETKSRDLELPHTLTEMDRGATREGGRNKERGGGLDQQTGAWMTQLVRQKGALGKGKTVMETVMC